MKICSLDGCGGKYFSKGLCRKHWTKSWKKNMDGARVCSIEHCGGKHHGKGFCESHYQSANKDRYNARRRASYKKKRVEKFCSIDGCGLKHKAKGLCVDHYKRHLDRIYRDKFSDDIKAKRAAYNAANLEKVREQRRKNYHANPKAAYERSKKYDQKKPEVKNASTAKRRATKLNATPSWANEFFIKEAYHLAKLRTKATGFTWEVDHIVPLQSKLVCGLHCETNIQVIPRKLNRSKGNITWPDMP